MKTNRMMLSLPNSGSTWLAGLIAKHMPGCRYYDKEFFNPVCNLKHEMTLRKQFGSELISCYKNIVSPGNIWIDDDIRSTWGSEGYNFDKECQSACKLPVFVRHFECFVLLRRVEEVFPPSRARVWSFYEHAWFALKEAGYAVYEDTTEGRAKEACKMLQIRLRSNAEDYLVPVVWHHELMAYDEVGIRQVLEPVLGFHTGPLAREIVATRKAKKIAA